MDYTEKQKICKEILKLIKKEKILDYYKLADRIIELNNPLYFKVISENSGFYKEYINSLIRASQEKEKEKERRPISPEECYFR